MEKDCSDLSEPLRREGGRCFMESVVIVSGLPRSGTSMMMRMLQAGGMLAVTDNLREADEDNPNGYFEFERVKQIKEDFAWISDAKGRAVKMVSMLLYDLPRDTEYKVVFMRRALNEILASQKVMLERMGKNADFDIEEMAFLFTKHLGEIEEWLALQKNMSVFYVNYRNVLDAPLKKAESINDFLEGGLDVSAMAAIVDESLYRQRGDRRMTGESGDRRKSTQQSSPAGDSTSDEEKIKEQLQALGYM